MLLKMPSSSGYEMAVYGLPPLEFMRVLSSHILCPGTSVEFGHPLLFACSNCLMEYSKYSILRCSSRSTVAIRLINPRNGPMDSLSSVCAIAVTIIQLLKHVFTAGLSENLLQYQKYQPIYSNQIHRPFIYPQLCDGNV